MSCTTIARRRGHTIRITRSQHHPAPWMWTVSESHYHLERFPCAGGRSRFRWVAMLRARLIIRHILRD